MKIGSKIIGDDKPAYIIAEIGGNFSTFEHGKKLINSAISSGKLRTMFQKLLLLICPEWEDEKIN